MLYHNKINVSEGIDIIKSKKSKERMICHYKYFKDIGKRYKQEVCNIYHDISMMTYKLENIAILNVKGLIIDVLFGI